MPAIHRRVSFRTHRLKREMARTVRPQQRFAQSVRGPTPGFASRLLRIRDNPANATNRALDSWASGNPRISQPSDYPKIVLLVY